MSDLRLETRYASRKFIVTMLVIVGGSCMSYSHGLSPELVELLKWTVGLYFGFNVSQKAAEWLASGRAK